MFSLILKERSSSLRSNSGSIEPVKIPLNLGSGYSAEFKVFDKDFVFVSVGFGFYCQMTWRESEQFCNSRIDILNKKIAKFSEKIRKIEEDLKVFNELIIKLA